LGGFWVGVGGVRLGRSLETLVKYSLVRVLEFRCPISCGEDCLKF